MILEKNKYNLIFIGTPDFSVPTLQTLINDEHFNIVAVITAPDAKIGRKQILNSPPVKVLAKEHNIPTFQPKNIKNITDEIKSLNPEIILTIAYGQIIPEQILNIPKHGCLNLHASLLPKYRGASPIQTAIAKGETKTGVTLMKMDKGCDTGNIITQEEIKIDNDETGESLHNKLSEISAQVTKKYLFKYLFNNLETKPQDDKKATLAPKLTRDSGKINWNKPAEEIERLVRAYYPWPGTWSTWNNKTLKIIKINANILDINKYKIGEVFLYDNKLAVQCGNNAIIIEQLQLAGKKQLTSQEFLAGYKNIMKTILK